MNEEIENQEESFPIITTFSELSIGEVFDFLGESYTKLSSLRAHNNIRKFDWMFPGETEINV